MAHITPGYSFARSPHPDGLYNGRITGTVSEMGVPGAYRVRLFDRRTAELRQETWSDASGVYVFDYLQNLEYFVVAFDHDGNPLNAAISDFVTTEPMSV